MRFGAAPGLADPRLYGGVGGGAGYGGPARAGAYGMMNQQALGADGLLGMDPYQRDVQGRLRGGPGVGAEVADDDGRGRGGLQTGDIRVMSVLYESTGERMRRFDEAIQFLESFTFPDSPVRGPATTLWCCKFIRQNGGSPMAWHHRWLIMVKLQPSDPYVTFHEILLKSIEIAVQYDQLHVSALASVEYQFRQVQMIEERYKDKVGSASSEQGLEISLVSGATHRSGLRIAPALSEWIAVEMRADSAIRKERRKQREERALGKPAGK